MFKTFETTTMVTSPARRSYICFIINIALHLGLEREFSSRVSASSGYGSCCQVNLGRTLYRASILRVMGEPSMEADVTTLL
jgi:hypothetical protein